MLEQPALEQANSKHFTYLARRGAQAILLAQNGSDLSIK
jgi:hypothetical protein